jgi:hypothetical protein
MPLQPNVTSNVIYAPEVVFGTAPVVAGQRLRRVSSSLSLSKDAITSNEVRSDQQVIDVRHGVRRAAGSIQGELSTQTYDDFLAAGLRSSWVAGVTANNTSHTSVLVTGSTFVFGSGSLITTGFKVGDIVRLSGFSHANVGRNFRITNLTATVMTVFPTPAAMTSQTTFTASVVGRKVTNGVLTPSFTIEQNYPDVDVSELFTGVRVNTIGLSMPPTGMASINMDLLGLNGTILSGAAAPNYASPTAETSTGILAGISGSLLFGGTQSVVVTGFDMSITNNLSAQPVVGSNVVPEIFYGRSVVTGNISAFFDSTAFLDAFNAETETSIMILLEASGVSPLDFLSISLQRVKLNGQSKTIGPDGGVIASFPFQALLKTGGAGTIYDQSTCVIQRSNA